jgi:hypothetical protein
MSRGNFTNTTAPPSMGIAPVHYSSGALRGYSRYRGIQYEKDEKAERSRIVGPYLSFETDRPAMTTFQTVLRILNKRDFPFVVDFDGPELGIVRPRDQLVWVDEVLEVLEEMDDTDVPTFLGIRATLMYKDDRDVTVRAKVKVGSETHVKLKVRGTVNRSTWTHVRADIKRKFHVKV